MNIFKILANGDGTINEANVSAFLGYLLDPYADHGLGFEFLEKFIKHIKPDFEVKKYDYEILFEQAFKEEDEQQQQEEKKAKQIVDIVILCFKDSRGDAKETFAKSIISNFRSLDTVFLIEIKIRKGSITKGQLKKQLDATTSELKNYIDIDNIYSLYITPENKEFNDEFKLLGRPAYSHHYAWKKDENNSIYEILKTIIHEESKGEIEAINEYTKHTIKSFIQFIANDFKSEQQEEKERKSYSVEGLEIIGTANAVYNDETITIKRYKNNWIRIFDSENNKKNVTVKNVLRELIEVYKLNVIENDSSTTQTLGRDVIDELIKQQP